MAIDGPARAIAEEVVALLRSDMAGRKPGDTAKTKNQKLEP